MVKHESLSSDMNFVKEFEELKLKQKLLIESLAHKKKVGMEKSLTDFNAKLDFLVQIFKEANNTEEEEANLDDHFQKIVDRIDSLDEKFEQRFQELESKMSGVKSEINKTGMSSDERTAKLNKELSNKDFSNSNKKNNEKQDDKNSPPPPDFKVDNTETKLNDKLEEVEAGKKKKSWFGKK